MTTTDLEQRMQTLSAAYTSLVVRNLYRDAEVIKEMYNQTCEELLAAYQNQANAEFVGEPLAPLTLANTQQSGRAKRIPNDRVAAEPQVTPKVYSWPLMLTDRKGQLLVECLKRQLIDLDRNTSHYLEVNQLIQDIQESRE